MSSADGFAAGSHSDGQPSKLAQLDACSAHHLEALADLEAAAAAAVAGETLLQFDRVDNVLLTRDRVCFVDWPYTCVGATWVDVVFFAPSVTVQGGPPPEEVRTQSCLPYRRPGRYHGYGRGGGGLLHTPGAATSATGPSNSARISGSARCRGAHNRPAWLRSGSLNRFDKHALWNFGAFPIGVADSNT